jgi:hypothetical protein
MPLFRKAQGMICCSLFQAALPAHRRTASAVTLLRNSFKVSETAMKVVDETSG